MRSSSECGSPPNACEVEIVAALIRDQTGADIADVLSSSCLTIRCIRSAWMTQREIHKLAPDIFVELADERRNVLR